MQRHWLLLGLAMALGAGAPAAADGPFGFRDEGVPIAPQVQFRDAHGGVFYPRGIALVTPDGLVRASIPGTARDTTWEHRIDLSALPLVGAVFQPVLDPAAAATGDLVGPVYRVGNDLVVAPSNWGPDLAERDVTLTAHVPGFDALRFDFGRLSFSRTENTAPRSGQIGMAYVKNGALVLASDSGTAQRPALANLLEDLLN